MSSHANDGGHEEILATPAKERLDTTIATSKLCQVCNSLNISAEDFLIRDGQEDERYKHETELGSLAELMARSHDCPLCWLVLDAARNPSIDANEYTTKCFLSWQKDGWLSGRVEPRARRLWVTMGPWPVSLSYYNKITCLSVDVDGDEHLFLGRKRTTKRLDVKLLRKWMRSCSRWHGDLCEERITTSTSILRVVDCWRLCITEVPPTARYLALSYVWGQAAAFKLTKENASRLTQERGLKEVWDLIPATIRDAIRVTSALTERYLWVDSLCIVQDDDADKKRLIPMMDRIYNQAMLTIVAGSGDNANAGLCGVDRSARSRPQSIREISPGLRLLSQTSLSEALDSSFYETRAWTYQERWLSRRCLYFFADQVVFQCRKTIWREDAILEDKHINDCHDMYRPHSIGTDVSATNPLTDYFDSVDDYAQRKLSSNADALNAFTGVCQILQTRMSKAQGKQVTSIYGLPSHVFDGAMLWDLHGVYATTRRNEGWPSWPWCGWKGGAIMNALPSLSWPERQAWFEEHTWVEWELFDDRGHKLSCIDTTTARAEQRRRFPCHALQSSRSPTPSEVKAKESLYLSRQSEPTTLSLPVLDTGEAILPLLHFSTFVVHFGLQAMDKIACMMNRCYLIMSDEMPVGAVRVPPKWKHETGRKYEMLLLSDARIRDLPLATRAVIGHSNYGWDAFNVMLVEQVPGLDIRERVALGILSQRAFDPAQAPPEAWQEIWLR